VFVQLHQDQNCHYRYCNNAKDKWCLAKTGYRLNLVPNWLRHFDLILQSTDGISDWRHGGSM